MGSCRKPTMLQNCYQFLKFDLIDYHIQIHMGCSKEVETEGYIIGPKLMQFTTEYNNIDNEFSVERHVLMYSLEFKVVPNLVAIYNKIFTQNCPEAQVRFYALDDCYSTKNFVFF